VHADRTRPVRIGLSGWNYAHWRNGVFYPPRLPASRWLEFYAERFDTVEVNSTFYRLPRRDAVAHWVAGTPDGFLFSVKASRYLTHVKRLRDLGPGLDRFLERIEPLLDSPKLGPLLWQLPPTFARDDERLAASLAEWPRGLRFAIEFRHESWFEDEVFDVLREHDVALCVGEQEDFTCPVQSTASWGYLRLHRLDYDAAALGTWAACVAAQGWSDAYVYFKHDEGVGSGPPAVGAFVETWASLTPR